MTPQEWLTSCPTRHTAIRVSIDAPTGTPAYLQALELLDLLRDMGLAVSSATGRDVYKREKEYLDAQIQKSREPVYCQVFLPRRTHPQPDRILFCQGLPGSDIPVIPYTVFRSAVCPNSD